MRRTVAVAVLLWCIAFFWPMVLPGYAVPPESDPEAAAPMPTPAVSPEDAQEPPEPTMPETPLQDEQTIVTVLDAEQVLTLTMADYLVGVLAREMPVSFPAQALRAQAVAARSYALYNASQQRHEQAMVCSDPSCCAAYADVAAQGEQLFGANTAAAIEILQSAVQDTDGMVVTYGGEPVIAAFHAVSGGMTESAADVWGGDVPYLVSVDSPGEEAAARFSGSVTVPVSQLREILQELCPSGDFSGAADTWLTDLQRSAAGGVRSLLVGGVSCTGTRLRTALGLNSTDFTCTVSDTDAVFTTTGYGHGVGLSQDGARAMALDGAGWEEIVLHYYSGCAVMPMAQLQTVSE